VIRNSIGELQCLACGRNPYQRDSDTIRKAIEDQEDIERKQGSRRHG
jgi:hypothetical protein